MTETHVPDRAGVSNQQLIDASSAQREWDRYLEHQYDTDCPSWAADGTMDGEAQLVLEQEET